MNYSNLLFVHIPKTGGQSVFSIINDEWNRCFPFNHDPLFLIEKNNQIESGVFKFSIVRNPYTRTFSYYKHFLNQYPEYYQWSFERFLFSIKNKTFFIRTPMILYPQSFYILNSKGEIGLNIFKYEKIDELQKTLKFKLPHLNKGNYNKTNYYEAYTTQNIKLVQEIYRTDFELLDYSLSFS